MVKFRRSILAIVIFWVLVNIVSAGQAATLGKTIPAQVVSVTDGDTITVRIKGRQEKVRLIGIDAAVDPSTWTA